MKKAILASMILGFAGLCLSHQAAAGWQPGPCPQPHTGLAPCIESITETAGTWHLNGDGSQPSEWHGAPDGVDFSFSGPVFTGCDALDIACTVTFLGQIRKCRDANGDWRVGVRATSFAMSGSFICNTVSLGGFPWYSTDSAMPPHCPFDDTCENFNYHTPVNNPYIFNMGPADVTVLFISRIIEGHIHDVEFHHGMNNTYFKFDSLFYDCSENPMGCYVEGELEYNGDTSKNHINIY